MSSNSRKPSVDKSKSRLQTTISKANNSQSTRIQSGSSDVFENSNMDIDNNNCDFNDFETVKTKSKRLHQAISSSLPEITKKKSNFVSNNKFAVLSINGSDKNTTNKTTTDHTIESDQTQRIPSPPLIFCTSSPFAMS